MTGKIFQPQISQMNAGGFLRFFICANLRSNKTLKEILERIGV